MKCERCPKTSVGYDLFNYCAKCSKNLCPDCIAKGCCGNVPAIVGDDEAAFDVIGRKKP